MKETERLKQRLNTRIKLMNRIKQLRKTKTNIEIAGILGITAPQCSNITNDKVRLRYKTMINYLDKLNG